MTRVRRVLVWLVVRRVRQREAVEAGEEPEHFHPRYQPRTDDDEAPEPASARA